MMGKVQDVRNSWNTRHESDHCLRIMDISLGGKEFAPAKKMETVGKTLRRDDVGNVVDAALRKAMPGVGEADRPDLCADLQFDGVIIDAADVDIHSTWDTLKKVPYDTAADLRQPPTTHYQGMTETTLILINKPTKLREILGGHRGTVRQQTEIRKLKRLIQRSVRRDKAAHLELQCAQVQTSAEFL
jgi:hypothetical protein